MCEETRDKKKVLGRGNMRKETSMEKIYGHLCVRLVILADPGGVGLTCPFVLGRFLSVSDCIGSPLVGEF